MLQIKNSVWRNFQLNKGLFKTFVFQYLSGDLWFSFFQIFWVLSQPIWKLECGLLLLFQANFVCLYYEEDKPTLKHSNSFHSIDQIQDQICISKVPLLNYMRHLLHFIQLNCSSINLEWLHRFVCQLFLHFLSFRVSYNYIQFIL